jgi:purine-binding chemotaxis protein CheW
MDIAEIRKKAKGQPTARAKAQDESDDLAIAASFVIEPAGPQASESAQEPLEVQDEATGVATLSDPLVTSGEALVATQKPGDGLDRLFAATEEFVMATDESYADILDEKVDAQAQSSCQYLAFHLCDEEYALDIRRISEIIKVREFTDIPRTPDFILGIISLRGVVVPVFDLRCRLNLDKSEITSASRIVVCQLDDVTVGLLVDSINQVVNIADAEIEPPPGVLAGLDREMVSGIGRYQGRMIILLNLHSALNVEQDEC